MSDIKLFWNNASGAADIAIADGDLVMDDGMETAVIVSFFTDRKAPADVDLPDGSDDRRGWWGDGFPEVEKDEDGSLEWLLDRGKIVPEDLHQLKDYSDDALAWMIADGVAKSVEVAVERLATNAGGRQVIITRPDGTTIKYDNVWEGK